MNMGDLSHHDAARVRELEKVRDGVQTPYEAVRRLRQIGNAERRAEKIERDRIAREQADIRKLGEELRRHRRDKAKDRSDASDAR